MPNTETGIRGELEPHELANELTRDPTVTAESSMPQTKAPDHDREDHILPPVETQVARSVWPVLLASLAIGLIVASILLRNVWMAILAAVFIVPFMLLVSMPVWLASTTKVAQDATVREQRGKPA